MSHVGQGRYVSEPYQDGRRAPRRSEGTIKGTMVARVNVCLTAEQWAFVLGRADGMCTVSQVIRDAIDAAMAD